MKIFIRKEGNRFQVEPHNAPGSPAVGRGTTLTAALGEFLIAYQKQLGIEEIIIDPTAQNAVDERIRRYERER